MRFGSRGLLATVTRMTSSEVWDEQTAATYDGDSAEMFAPEVLAPPWTSWPGWPPRAPRSSSP